eukprot:TRINITY_DN12540_c2_g2_i2.p3 TRINITY_DN12540_c2_g2~~TRINITY_DN12540_c2_g2_i2.p3  ORF type:complete len:114 (-),score=6.92 TRINITY_DN12540_c2_g2_i2:1561-1902(-)
MHKSNPTHQSKPEPRPWGNLPKAYRPASSERLYEATDILLLYHFSSQVKPAAIFTKSSVTPATDDPRASANSSNSALFLKKSLAICAAAQPSCISASGLPALDSLWWYMCKSR